MGLPRLRNRDGTPIDPVPLLVVVLTLFLITHSMGPLYLDAFGFSVPQSLVIVTVVFLALVALAYHQLVWVANPEHTREVSPAARLDRLLYAVFILIALLVLLLLPLLRWSVY